MANSALFDRDEIQDIYRPWRLLLESYGNDKMAVVEAWVAPERASRYVAPDTLHQIFGFDFLVVAWDAKSIRDNWYFTGDLGYVDDDGELYVVGRVDDMVISGGENIYPEEVEDVLAKSPLVEQVAVIGMPDDRMGSKVVAFVEPAAPDCSADALNAWCLDSTLARFKRPRAYVFVKNIPRSAAGKLLRRFLRDGDYELNTDFQSAL